MGQANIRLATDQSTGHGCWPPTVPASASINVFVNGKAEVRVGDTYVSHCCPKKGCHVGTALTGATRTYTNKRITHTKGGQISCGNGSHLAANGSPNVFSG